MDRATKSREVSQPMDRLEATRYAGHINQGAIEHGFTIAQPGISLLEIDAAIESYLLKHNCKPAFKGYRDFPATSCLSTNDVVVHGVPTNYRLKDGDILTIDVGCSHETWMVDAARTRIIGPARPGFFLLQERLIAASESVLQAEMSVIKSGVSLLEVVLAAESRASELGVSIFPQWGGHQIGQKLHIDPFVPNCIDPSLTQIKRWQLEREYDKYKLAAGQVFCLEPIVTFGKTDIIVDEDGWTVRTMDGSLSSHSERCILVTETGYQSIS